MSGMAVLRVYTVEKVVGSESRIGAEASARMFVGCGGEFFSKDEMSRVGIGVGVVSDEDEISESVEIDVVWSKKKAEFSRKVTSAVM